MSFIKDRVLYQKTPEKDGKFGWSDEIQNWCYRLDFSLNDFENIIVFCQIASHPFRKIINDF